MPLRSELNFYLSFQTVAEDNFDDRKQQKSLTYTLNQNCGLGSRNQCPFTRARLRTPRICWTLETTSA
ncbi:hypothetical protein C8R44DRAFT_776829 [Mycena epipterygia]|nr:hypothetical protein C8R44DRAFT_776829 [Mycena epipterygia]